MAKKSSNRSSEGTIESYVKPPLQSPVLCVDLDGTFLKADTLVECFIEAIRKRAQVFCCLSQSGSRMAAFTLRKGWRTGSAGSLT